MSTNAVVDFKDALRNMQERGKLKSVKQALKVALFAGALLIQGRARTRILKGPKSGIVYGPARIARIANRGGQMSKSQAKKVHQASAPGEAPANETGNLARMIVVVRPEQTGETFTAQVLSTSKYAAALEYGTRKAGKNKSTVILERPYMRPSVDESVKQIDEMIRAAVSAAMAGG